MIEIREQSEKLFIRLEKRFGDQLSKEFYEGLRRDLKAIEDASVAFAKEKVSEYVLQFKGDMKPLEFGKKDEAPSVIAHNNLQKEINNKVKNILHRTGHKEKEEEF